jgi:GNAT superfamily N-acetyltransferase
MAEVEITEASAADVPGIVALRAEVAQDMTSRFGEGPWSVETSAADVIRQLRASQVLVARRGEDILGAVRLAVPIHHALEAISFTPVASSLYVLGLAVAPLQRGRGLGGRLIAAAKDAARARSIQALWLDTYADAAGASPFYVRCGFRQVASVHDQQWPLLFYEYRVS